MADVIQLLPDAIANQIAAGEVIQRPASVVKELVENAIDAGSTRIKIIIKEAGKSLIQIIDNGCGMSETDARLSFERHATSKIKKAEDLFAIHTMGFRGEALASIASIAQVELQSRQQKDELGTKLVVEATKVLSQEACQCPAGTNIAIKNLFYNIPARRKFLKSNTVEMRHILDEFQRVAIANPDIFFTLHHNNTEVYHLPEGNMRQRIVNVLGSHHNKKLVPVSEQTDIITIKGFIGKPEFAKKTRGEQFFFVNKRFIKSSYLHHALISAYEDLLSKENYPLYVIFIDIDPSSIDINVHPTKQEIKFDDERLVYNYLKVGVRHALGQYSITPTLDFDQDSNITNQKGYQNHSTSSPLFDKKEKKESTTQASFSPTKNTPERIRQTHNLENWEKLYQGLDVFDDNTENIEADFSEDTSSEPITIQSKWTTDTPEMDDKDGSFSKPQKEPYQVQNTYIISQIKSGFLLIDQQAAHERILFEKYLEMIKNEQTATQKELFPKTIMLSPSEAALFNELLTYINNLGFDIREFGNGSFVVHGIPANFPDNSNVQEIIERLLEQYLQNIELKLNWQDNLARVMAKSAATKRGKSMTVQEMKTLIDQLFACQVPYKSPGGRNCFITFELDALQKKFEA